ncbi:MAG TPA: patatin-like phospholipase family protein [Gemmatimonadaceae bacterium]|nr:patatin-like phospholipase family protein [Gemmatimonadaceae bacterium]
MPRLARALVLPVALTAISLSCNSAINASGLVPQFVESLVPPANPPHVAPIRGGTNGGWGLALSGGGIRSATFSIGVMKALYDLGYLDSVDVVSSVSGGGFASYWLFRKELGAIQNRFGDAVFSNATFDKSVCELQAMGNFQSFGQMIASGLSSDSFEKYRWAIRRSFGFDGGISDPEPPLNALMPHIERGTMPLFILNATIDAPNRGKFPNVIEVTPAFIGSPSIGYHSWTTADTLPGWSESIAVSGAAIPTLKHHLRAYTGRSPDSLRLWDGGESENLGALSLIRRRIRNIVIVDGEHDPDYNFAGYFMLKKLLPAEGFDISIPSIDEFIGQRGGARARFDAHAVSVGIAYSSAANGTPSDTSRIFYVKLARPKSIEALLDTASDAYRRGAQYQTRINTLTSSAGTGSDPLQRCAPLAGHDDGFHMETAIYNVTNFAQLMDRIQSEDRAARNPTMLRFAFPQTSSIDQSYFADQLKAFIGLGYLEGMQLHGKGLDRN